MCSDGGNLFKIFFLSTSLNDGSAICEHGVISGLSEDQDDFWVNASDFISEVATTEGSDLFEILSGGYSAAFNDVCEVDGISGDSGINGGHRFNDVIEEGRDFRIIGFTGHDAIGFELVGVTASADDEELSV